VIWIPCYLMQGILRQLSETISKYLAGSASLAQILRNFPVHSLFSRNLDQRQVRSSLNPPPDIPRFLLVFQWFSDGAQKTRQWGLLWDGHSRNYRSAPESRGFGAGIAPKFSVGRFRGQHVPMAQSCSDAMIGHNHCDIDDGILNGEWVRKLKRRMASVLSQFQVIKSLIWIHGSGLIAEPENGSLTLPVERDGANRP
jgi:hypothetical protein